MIKNLRSTVFKRKTVLSASNVPKTCKIDSKLWQQILNELTKETFKFGQDITENIVSYDQLVDFAVKCHNPLTWLERAKETAHKIHSGHKPGIL